MQQIAKKFGMEEEEIDGKIDWERFDKQIEERNSLRKKKAKNITNFTVGDKVLIKNTNMGKLESRWKGPYKVSRKISNHLYELENKKTKIRRHIELMKRYNDDDDDDDDDDGDADDEETTTTTRKNDEPLFEVEEILDHGKDEDDNQMFL